jgi:hypothetical protein
MYMYYIAVYIRHVQSAYIHIAADIFVQSAERRIVPPIGISDVWFAAPGSELSFLLPPCTIPPTTGAPVACVAATPPLPASPVLGPLCPADVVVGTGLPWPPIALQTTAPVLSTSSPLELSPICVA